MDYYHGQALVMGEPTEIRVKPENIQGEFVSEFELYLPTSHAVPRSPGSNMVNIEQRWGWQIKKRENSPPAPVLNIWVEINSEKKTLKFREKQP